MRRALMLLAVLLSSSAGAQSAASWSWARISYISGGTVYVDAGSRAGLREGGTLDVVRGGEGIAQLTVAFISSTRAACTIARSTAEPAVGDSVRFVPAVTPVAPAAGPDRSDLVPARPHRASVHGRLGLRYFVSQPGSGAPTMTRPGADLRLEGHQVGGSPLGILIDVRAYRQRSSTTGGAATSSTRVYQGHVEWNATGSPVRVSIGRQLSPALSTLGVFDGMSLEVTSRHLNVGAVGAAQPDPVSYGVSGAVREYGAYAQAHGASTGAGLWSITMGGIGSYSRGEIDREFGYLQAMLGSRHVSLFATQEVDLNRGWKADVEGRSTVPTSSFALVRVSPSDVVSFTAGFDNRRSVRLYRDFVDPVTEFDDTFRQGVWAGVSVNAGAHVRMSTDARQTRGGAGNDSRSYTGSIGVFRISPIGFGASVRGSAYDGVARGQLFAGSIEVNPMNLIRIEASGGIRSDLRPVADVSPRNLRWQGIDADFVLGRSLYLMLSAYREFGDAGRSTQGYAALSWRF